MEPSDCTTSDLPFPLHICRESLLGGLTPGNLSTLGLWKKEQLCGLLNLSLLLSSVCFVIDFSSLMHWLVSGRAGDKPSGNQGLRALCSSFYPSNFMQLEPWVPLSWGNAGTVLNHKVQAGDRSLATAHPQAPKLPDQRNHP